MKGVSGTDTGGSGRRPQVRRRRRRAAKWRPVGAFAAVAALLVPLTTTAPAHVPAGPGPFPAAVQVSGSSAGQLPPPRPAGNWGPAADQVGLVFTSAGTGFLASGPSAYGTPAGVPAEIQRTADQGRTWRTVWRGSSDRVTWLGITGAGMSGDAVAHGAHRSVGAGLAGGAERQPSAEIVAAGSTAEGRPFLLKSDADGDRWQLQAVSLSGVVLPTGVYQQAAGPEEAELWATYRFDFVTPSLGFAAPDPMVGQATFLPGQLLRTTDGGRHWAAVRLPDGVPTGGIDFVSARAGFATGTEDVAGQSARCRARLWATTDGGAKWRPVAGTCTGYELSGLDFVSPTTGFAVGGQYLKYSGYGQEEVVLKTTDGGGQWRLAWRATIASPNDLDANFFAQVGFFSPEVGLALDGGMTAGANGPVGGHLWRTVDGGRAWAELPEQGLRLALDGPDGAWLVEGKSGQEGDVLWRSLDRGRSWSPVGNAERVSVNAVSGYGSDLWVSTEAGDFLSYDGGRSWRRPPSAMEAAEGGTWPQTAVQQARGGAVIVGPGWAGDGYLWLSSDGGRHGTLRRLPLASVGGVGALAFSDARHGLAVGLAGPDQLSVVVATADGGRSWQVRGSLGTIVLGLAYDGTRAVAVGSEDGQDALAVSTDAGRTWTINTTGDELCGAVSAFGATVAMWCSSLHSSGQQVLVSRDGGRRWEQAGDTRPIAGYASSGSIVVTGRSTLWASGPPGALWRSSDAGVRWQAVPLLLPLVP